MNIEKAGRYLVKTAFGNRHEIEIVERNGEFGVMFERMNSFLPISKFKGVEVLCRNPDERST